MYEGDTMSEMFKRTKKCCAKLFRKISFNTSEPPSIPLRIGGQSARYTQQRNRTNSDNSPQNSCGSRESNQHVNAINSSFSDDGSCDENECNMFRISPRIFTAKGTSYVRVDSDSKNFCSLDAAEEQPARSRKQTTKSQNKSSNEGDGMCSIGGSKVYIGLNERTQERINKTCNNNCTVVAKPSFNSGLASVKSGDAEKKPSINCSDHKTETTSFIVAQNLIEKFDSCLNLAAQNFRNSLSPRIYSTRDNNGVRRCCRTANFNILEEDANENVTACHGEYTDFDFKKVVFEKVKYDRNKKYLRHTPSTSSAESASSSPKSPCDGTLISFGKSRSTLSLDNSISEQDFPVNPLPYPHYTSSWNEENGNFDKFNGNFELYTSDTHLPSVDNLPNRFFSQWDGNGNSCERTKILSDDPWDVFDNKMNKARDKKLQLLRREDFNKTSPRSSSTTLETWVEDEIFDNSFNEGLEKRCITIER